MYDKRNTDTVIPRSAMVLGVGEAISVESFKVLLEMFTEEVAQSEPDTEDEQVRSARAIVRDFYEYGADAIPSVALEMFNDRLVGNLLSGPNGKLAHSKYQPAPVVRYASVVTDWGLRCGFIGRPQEVTLH